MIKCFQKVQYMSYVFPFGRVFKRFKFVLVEYGFEFRIGWMREACVA